GLILPAAAPEGREVSPGVTPGRSERPVNDSPDLHGQAMDATSLAVLLIENDSAEGHLVRDALADERHGGSGLPRFAVTHCRHVGEGIERLRGGGFDVVLLDLSQPGGDQLETFERARSHARELPIVVLTTQDDERVGMAAVQAGAQDYLSKRQLEGTLLSRALRYAVERHRLQVTLRQLSLTDQLTGLYNRRGFLTLSEHHLKLVRRTRGLLLLYADVDGMQEINDTYGPHEGDRAIIKAAEVLRATFRASDVVARMGGDEFAVLVLDTENEGDATLAPRLRGKLDAFNRQKRLPYTLSLSIGVTYFDHQEPPSLDALLARAVHALREQKRPRPSAS
ncbi:MAG: GGDEF domain-containing response regulator, partial [Gemmatimonadaceae bacterium]